MQILFLLSSCLFAWCSAQEEGDVRLLGPNDYKGTVAIYHNGQWGSVCDDSWNYADADVVCRQLGFEKAYRIFYRAFYGQAPGPIWMDQVSCSSDATTLLDCDHNGWGIHNCEKREDAGVECLRKFPRKPLNMEVRLMCPECVQWGSCVTCPRKPHPSPTDCSTQATVEGIVFANYRNQWLPVTGEDWDIKDAQVVCGELGYPLALPVPALSEIWTNWDGKFLEGCAAGGSSYPRCSLLDDGIASGVFDGLCMPEEVEENNRFRDTLQKTFLAKVQCEGTEKRLLDCYFPEFGPHDNPNMKVATVRCGFKPHQSCPSPVPHPEIYRTRGGAVPWEGRVEVLVNGEWGTICDTDWNVPEANIVCKAMGYGTAVRAHYRAFYGRGVGPIHYTQLRCTGRELTLGACTKETGHIAELCGHRGDAGVMCNTPVMCDAGANKVARLLPVPQLIYAGYIDHYVQVQGSHGWGVLCRKSLNVRAAGVICRSEQQRFAIQTRPGSLPGYTGPYYNGTLDCQGDEASMQECTMNLQFTTSCEQTVYGGDAILDCSTGLPDLVPDLKTIEDSIKRSPYINRLPMYYLRCAKEENCLSSSANFTGPNDLRHLLRFDSLTMNWGTSDFLPNQRRDQWQFHTCHNHYHSFEAFIHYDLLNLTTGQKVAEGHKASFCLEDSLCRNGAFRRYGCSSGNQGISANCGDLYGSHLDCQWIDITDVPLGSYLLRLIVNPDYLVAETDHRNNIVTCSLSLLPGFIMQHHWCRLSDH